MFKKLLYTFFAITTLLSFAACGTSDKEKEPTPTVAVTSALEKEEQPKEDDTKNNTDSTDNTTNNLGTLNPFRYRSYYYDIETGLYYLKTRYYSPEWCRFIKLFIRLTPRFYAC